MARRKLLEQEIETLRHEVIRIAMIKGFTDFEVIFLNRKLNKRLNEYERLSLMAKKRLQRLRTPINPAL